MDLQLGGQQTAKFVSLASRTERGAADLIVEAVDWMIAETDLFHAQMQARIDQIARGNLIEEEEMDARVARMRSSSASSISMRRRLPMALAALAMVCNCSIPFRVCACS